MQPLGTNRERGGFVNVLANTAGGGSGVVWCVLQTHGVWYITGMVWYGMVWYQW